MPGLCGIITPRPAPLASDELSRMSARLFREPFYHAGSWIDERAGLYCAWTCVSGSFSDCLPVWNEKKNIVLLFAGEHIGEKEEIVDLKRRNHAIRKQDASYLVHAFEEKGARDFARGLNGAFHGLVFDGRSGEAFLFNDRLGHHRLFVRQCRDAVYFSTEIAPLADIGPAWGEVDTAVAERLLRQGRLGTDETVFRNLETLPGASLWRIVLGRVVQRGRYFDVKEWDDQPFLGRDYFCARFAESIARVLPAYLRTESGLAFWTTHGSGTIALTSSADFPHGKAPLFGVAPQTAVDSDSHAGSATEFSRVGFDPQPSADALRLLETAVRLTGSASDDVNAGDLAVARAARRFAPVTVSALFFNDCLVTRSPKNVTIDLGAAVSDPTSAVADSDAANLPRSEASHTAVALLRSQVAPRTPFNDVELVTLLHRVPPQTDYIADAIARMLRDAEGKSYRFGSWLREVGFGPPRPRITAEAPVPAIAWASAHNGSAEAFRELLLRSRSSIGAMLCPGAIERLFAAATAQDRSVLLTRLVKLELLLGQARRS